MGLQENMKKEPVSRLAMRKLITAQPTDTVRQAVEKMREMKLGCVIVIDKKQKPLGIFTESILRQLVVKNSACLDEPIEAHMMQPCPRVEEADPIIMVLDAMQARNHRFVCVVDKKGRAIALTGQRGLMEYIAEHFPEQVMVQSIGNSPFPKQREGA